MAKKYGGKIHKWQLHTLNYSKNSLKMLKTAYPDAITKPSPIIFTGILKKDATGRWCDGSHIKSSLIVKIDRELNKIETCNTVYDFDPKTENQDLYVDKDMGNFVLNLQY